MAMQWFRTIPALILAVIWPLVTSHCKLEQIPGLTFLACEKSVPHQENDCATDGCAVFESGLYKSESDQVHVTPPASAFIVLLLFGQDEGPRTCFNSRSELVPPELPRSWQFAHRAALLPRAPTIPS